MTRDRRIMLVGAIVLLGVLAVAAAVGVLFLGGEAGHRRAVVFAAAVTGSGSIAGWLVARQARGQPAAVAVAGGLAATVVRMLPMLVALGWLVGQDEAPWARTAGGLLVAFHLILLVADMALHAMLGREPGRAPRAPENRRSAGGDIAN
ncbi:MAG: hypothetical protein FJ284_10045 [Planctomycetes bacterium]|nr:hypothetical protein [Planctomycetota bacterium]